MAARTHYQILGLDPRADDEQIKAAFRVAVKRHHPDHGGDPAVFQQVKEAHDVLSDPRKRAAYDAATQRRDDVDSHVDQTGPARGPAATPLTHPRLSRRSRTNRWTLKDLVLRESGRLSVAAVLVAVLVYVLTEEPTLPVFGSLGLDTVANGWGHLPYFLAAGAAVLLGWAATALVTFRRGDTRRRVVLVRQACSWLVFPALAPAVAATFLIGANLGLIVAAVWVVWALVRS